MWQFVKGVKDPSIPKFKVDKPLSRSQAEYKKRSANELSNHTEKLVTYSYVHIQALC